MEDYTPRELRLIATKIAGETAGLLRDLACSDESLSTTIKGETARIDLIAEDYIISALKEELGNVKIVTEERGSVGKGSLTAIVDPLDGSKNYLNCIWWSSVSIAFAPSNSSLNSIIAGAVAPIFHGEPLSFEKNGGCYIGYKRIIPRDTPEKFIFIYIDHPDAARNIANVIFALGMGYKIRSLGSAALEISYVGIGRGTAFIDLRSKLRNVDLAAAAGIVRECGGEIIGSNGLPLDIPVNRVVKAGTVIAVPKKNMTEKIFETVSKHL